MAAFGKDNSPKGPQGEWLPHGEDKHQTAHRGQNCITARTTLNGPQGAKLHHWEDTHQRPTGGNLACNVGARHVKIASLGGHPSMAHGMGGGQKCLYWRSRTCEKCITVMTPINGPQGAKLPVMEEQSMDRPQGQQHKKVWVKYGPHFVMSSDHTCMHPEETATVSACCVQLTAGNGRQQSLPP